MKRTRVKPLGVVMRAIIVMLLISGTIRLSAVGVALAREVDNSTLQEAAVCHPDEDLAELLEIIASRTEQLDEKERLLAMKQSDLDAAEELIRIELARLEEAEQRLNAAIETVDGASENDIGRLTAMYESMKPQIAAELFSQMTPNFAAGFIGQMSPKAAADIMSGLAPETAYAISVVLAGRNANVPTE